MVAHRRCAAYIVSEICGCFFFMRPFLLATLATMLFSVSAFAAKAEPVNGLSVGALSVILALIWFCVRLLSKQLLERKNGYRSHR